MAVESTRKKGDPNIAGILMSTDAAWLGLAGTTVDPGSQMDGSPSVLSGSWGTSCSDRERGMFPATTGTVTAVVKSTKLRSAVMFTAKLRFLLAEVKDSHLQSLHPRQPQHVLSPHDS